MDAIQTIGRPFARLLNEVDSVPYPDFDAMWIHIREALPADGDRLLPASEPKAARIGSRGFVIAAAVALLTVTPIAASTTLNWDHFLYRNGGVRSALQQGLGQTLEQSAKLDGVTLTVHNAIADDNRTVLLFTVDAPQLEGAMTARFAELTVHTADGQVVKGDQRFMWDQTNHIWRGYFEAQWTMPSEQGDVQLVASRLQAFSPKEQVIPLLATSSGKQTFAVGRDDIDKITIQPIDQGDTTMLDTSVFFSRSEAKGWALPSLVAEKAGKELKETRPGIYGKPGEQGEYTVQQMYSAAQLQDSSLQFKLQYAARSVDLAGTWAVKLHLDKRPMVSGTIKRELNIPVTSAAGTMTLKELTVTPTQVKISAVHEPNKDRIMMKHHLEIGGTVIPNGNTFQVKSPEETEFDFDVPPNVKVSKNTPISLVMNYEVVAYENPKDSVMLTNIGNEKQVITTQIGGYPVQWTYYRQDGDLYVQSKSDNPLFGGVRQTFMMKNGKSLPSDPLIVRFDGDGTNKSMDVYRQFTGQDAQIFMYAYTINHPDKEIRVKLNPPTVSQP